MPRAQKRPSTDSNPVHQKVLENVHRSELLMKISPTAIDTTKSLRNDKLVQTYHRSCFSLLPIDISQKKTNKKNRLDIDLPELFL